MDEPVDSPTLTVCLLVFALTFPGPQPLPRPPAGRARGHLHVLAGAAGHPAAVRLRDATACTTSKNDVLLAWAMITPICCNRWRCGSARPHPAVAGRATPVHGRTAVVVGGGPLGVKVVQARCRASRTAASISSAISMTARMSACTKSAAIQLAWAALKDVSDFRAASTACARFTSPCRWARSRASSSCWNRCRAPPRRCSSCPTCSASASSRAGCRT